MISLDSIDGTRENPRYADPNRANPSQNARLVLSSMDGEQDRDQEDAQRQAEDAAVPGLIGLTKGGKADPKDQDEDHEVPRWKRKRLMAWSLNG